MLDILAALQWRHLQVPSVPHVSGGHTNLPLALRRVPAALLIALRVGLVGRAEPVVLVILVSQGMPRLGRVVHVAQGIT